jgi:hypothetical protein
MFLKLHVGLTGTWRTDSKFSLGFSTTTLALWRQVLPEQCMVEMPTTVEVNQRLEGNGGCDVVPFLRILKLLICCVIAVDICLVVIFVMQLHNPSRNMWFQCAIVILNADESVIGTHL